MTRSDAVLLQHLVSCGKHDGAVIWQGKPYYLEALNSPARRPQMAKIHDAYGDSPERSLKGGWVLLAQLEEVPF